MKEVFQKLVELFPAYFDNLLTLATGPKRFVAGKMSGEGRHIDDAMVFLAISFLLSWALKIPLVKSDPLIELVGDAVFFLTLAVSAGCALLVAWRIAGGKADARDVLTTHFYYWGVGLFIMAITYLSMIGILRALDPDLYKELLKAVEEGNAPKYFLKGGERLFARRGFRFAMVAWFLGASALLAWFIAGWGAYRKLHGATKRRSVAAGFLFLVSGIPVWVFALFLANALVK
jgi:hypothetical protein